MYKMKYDNYLTVILILNIISILVGICSGSLIYMTLSGVNIAVSIWGKEKDLVAKNNSIYLIMAIINFISLKFVSGGFFTALNLLVSKQGNDKRNFISKKVVKKEVVDPQIRKIDILLKLGVGMVFIAGFVFATTGWYSLNSIIKIFIFVVIAALFIGLSKFCEKKIKIKATIYLYWILGMAFIVLAFLTIGYSEMFGSYFSLLGEGNLLYISFCLIICSVLGLITYCNFKDKIFLNIVYTGIFFAIILIAEYFGLILEEIIILLLPLLTVIKLSDLNKEKDIYTLSIFADICLCILGAIYICFIGSYSNVLAVLFSTILFVFNIYRYIYNNRESDLCMFASILSYIVLIPSLILILKYDSSLWVIVTTLFITLLFLISLLFKNLKLKTSSLITADVITLLVFLISTDGPIWLPLFVSAFSMLICIVCTYIDSLDEYDFEIFIHPAKISMLLFSIIFLLNNFFEFSNVLGYWLSSSLLTYILIYSLSRNNRVVDIYEKYSLVAIVIALLFTNAIPNIIISVVIFVSIILFYADVNWTKNCNRVFKNSVFVLLLVNVFVSSYAIENSLNFAREFSNSNYFFANIFSTVLFLIIGCFHRKDDFKLNLSLFAVIVPIIALIETYSDLEWIAIILPSVFVYYLTFCICRLFKDNNQSKDIIGYMGYSFAFLLVLFNSNGYVLAYTFILLFISILLGYFDKNYNALFKVSVVGIIIEILYQLKEFWNLIPAWLYLLIVGLGLIIFATYKQLKIVEKGDKK